MTANSSPNSSPMMLRSHCRSGADLFPRDCNYYTLFVFILSISSLITVVTHGIFYKYYVEPEHHQIAQEISLLKQELQHYTKQTENIVESKLDLYDADKTNQTDYALEPSGGVIVTTRCTKTYLENNIEYSIDGLLPLFYTSNSARLVIQPGLVPGECWCFNGSEGSLVIKLSRIIIPTSFTYEHIRKQLTPGLNIDSAPKHFRIKSLKNENDRDGLLLGEYEYDQNGKPMQQFKVQNPDPVPTQFIELFVQSNHGELHFTCLYRLRVHGTLCGFE